VIVFGVLSHGSSLPHFFPYSCQAMAEVARASAERQQRVSWDQVNKKRVARGEKSMPMPAERIPKVASYEHNAPDWPALATHLEQLDTFYSPALVERMKAAGSYLIATAKVMHAAEAAFQKHRHREMPERPSDALYDEWNSEYLLLQKAAEKAGDAWLDAQNAVLAIAQSMVIR
jgi:hypothetical protein